jgi:TrmH family RNA methyltransferase
MGAHSGHDMPSFKVVLVEPQVDGNVGAVARSMANFGFTELCMVNACPITDEGYKRAKHAGYILDQAKHVATFEEAISDCFLIVGTSGIITHGDRHYARIPLTPRQFADRAKDSDDRIALVFGREDLGLTQEQLIRCDLLVSIPSHEDYPVLNLSHAATILMYEVYAGGHQHEKPNEATEHDKELLFGRFMELLEAIDYPSFRRERTNVMFRRMMGRALPTRYEYHTIMGVIGGAAEKIRRLRSERGEGKRPDP